MVGASDFACSIQRVTCFTLGRWRTSFFAPSTSFHARREVLSLTLLEPFHGINAGRLE
jgi:hypothetical protein